MPSSVASRRNLRGCISPAAAPQGSHEPAPRPFSRSSSTSLRALPSNSLRRNNLDSRGTPPAFSTDMDAPLKDSAAHTLDSDELPLTDTQVAAAKRYNQDRPNIEAAVQAAVGGDPGVEAARSVDVPRPSGPRSLSTLRVGQEEPLARPRARGARGPGAQRGTPGDHAHDHA
jgi:hypothetical protein